MISALSVPSSDIFLPFSAESTGRAQKIKKKGIMEQWNNGSKRK
jgi:hypothetical protein